MVGDGQLKHRHLVAQGQLQGLGICRTLHASGVEPIIDSTVTDVTMDNSLTERVTLVIVTS